MTTTLAGTFSDIADAIRSKNGSSNTYTPAQMPSAIQAIPTGGSNPLKFGVLRPDAELIQTYSYDKKIVEDEEKTIPAYSTDTTTFIAGAELTPTISMDFANYEYFVLIRMLTIPDYGSDTTTAKGREEWIASSCLYEVCDFESGALNSLLNPSKYTTARSTSIISAGAFHRLLYWSTTSAITLYTGASYGASQTVTAPTVSGTTLTLKNPAQILRGSTTYLTQTYFEKLQDIRYQWKIEVYRSPINATLRGWGMKSQMLHVVDDVYSNTHTLT